MNLCAFNRIVIRNLTSRESQTALCMQSTIHLCISQNRLGLIGSRVFLGNLAQNLKLTWLWIKYSVIPLYCHVFTNLRLIIDVYTIIGKKWFYRHQISFTLWYSIGRYYVTTVTININIIDVYTETTAMKD
jgi:hypothetical protein